MASPNDRPRLDARFYGMLVAAGPITYLVHEGAHRIVGRAVGLDVAFSLNGVTPIGGATQDQALAMSAAGPAITYVQALIAYLAVRRLASPVAFVVLLWAAFMRVVATGISIVLPNDEARVGLALGLGYWTVPLVASGLLCALAWSAARAFHLRVRDYLICYVLLSVVTAAIVFGDRFLL